MKNMRSAIICGKDQVVSRRRARGGCGGAWAAFCGKCCSNDDDDDNNLVKMGFNAHRAFPAAAISSAHCK